LLQKAKYGSTFCSGCSNKQQIFPELHTLSVKNPAFSAQGKGGISSVGDDGNPKKSLNQKLTPKNQMPNFRALKISRKD